MPTAEQIDTSLNTITDFAKEPMFARLLGRVANDVFDTKIDSEKAASNWLGILFTKLEAELCDYQSSTIDTAIKDALTNITMATAYAIPINSDTAYFQCWRGSDLNAYRYSKELNHETAKWNLQNAYNGFKTVRQAQTRVYWRFNPDTGAVERMFGGRWHQSGCLSRIWTLFYDMGITEALQMAEDEWNHLNSVYWNTDHFIYAPDWVNWEMTAPRVFFAYLTLWLRKNRTLPNFERIVTDIENRYLLELWGSPQWGGYKVTIHHYSGNLERRLDAQLSAIGLLHLVYPLLSQTAKGNFRKLLKGEEVTSMNDALLGSDLFDSATNRFRLTSGLSLTDSATLYGCVALFLQSIIPDSGFLAVPIQSVAYRTNDVFFADSHHFGFDYGKKQIKIPCFSGRIEFKLGTALTSYDFPTDGIYQVTFSDDWNSITAVEKVGDLDREYIQAPAPAPAPAPTVWEIMMTHTLTLLSIISFMLLLRLLNFVRKTIRREE